MDKNKHYPEKYYTGVQYYRGIPLKLIVYTEGHFEKLGAKRFMLGDPKYNQNIWIPNKYLDETGRLLGYDLDWAFKKAYRQNKFKYAHIDQDPYQWKGFPDVR